MAWRCSGKTNAELVENLWRNRLIRDGRVKAAFSKVFLFFLPPFHFFFPEMRDFWFREGWEIIGRTRSQE
jgi:hypothetical protein